MPINVKLKYGGATLKNNRERLIYIIKTYKEVKTQVSFAEKHNFVGIEKLTLKIEFMGFIDDILEELQVKYTENLYNAFISYYFKNESLKTISISILHIDVSNVSRNLKKMTDDFLYIYDCACFDLTQVAS